MSPPRGRGRGDFCRGFLMEALSDILYLGIVQTETRSCRACCKLGGCGPKSEGERLSSSYKYEGEATFVEVFITDIQGFQKKILSSFSGGPTSANQS